MSDFSQTSAEVTTLHVLRSDPGHLKSELWRHSRGQRVVLVVPCLATEFTTPDNEPVFANILQRLKRATYLKKIIFGLDRAGLDEALKLEAMVRRAGLNNAVIQWNDGPEFSRIYDRLNRADLNVSRPGKGRNMFLSFGLALAMEADYIGLIDADIRTFRARQLHRLLFPVVVLDHDFAKSYYSRIHNDHLYGRIKRLLVDPLLLALKRKFSYSKDDKFIGLIDYLLTFKYQLSGEVAFSADLLRRTRFATDWGVEIYTLIEAHRKAASICQVHFSSQPFDHKHQDIPADNNSPGLHRMAEDIINTLMNALVVEEGLEVTAAFFRDLAVTYQAVAEQLIKKYSHDAAFNNLAYDRDAEEKWVRNVFRTALVAAGERVASPSRMSEMFLFHVNTHPEFRDFVDSGLDRVITGLARREGGNLFEVPQTASWERAASKMPDIMDDILDAAADTGRRLVGRGEK